MNSCCPRCRLCGIHCRKSTCVGCLSQHRLYNVRYVIDILDIVVLSHWDHLLHDNFRNEIIICLQFSIIYKCTCSLHVNSVSNLFVCINSFKKKNCFTSTCCSEKDGELLRLRSEATQLRGDNAHLQRTLTSLEGDYGAAQAQVAALKRTVAEVSAAQEQIRASLAIAKVWRNVWWSRGGGGC